MTLYVQLPNNADLYVKNVSTFRFSHKQLYVLFKQTYSETTKDGLFGFTVNCVAAFNGVIGFRHIEA